MSIITWSDLVDKFREYQKQAATTAQPEAYSLGYILPGIAGEVGECLGHIAKSRWHGTDPQEELVYELGDVCWMIAIGLKHLEPYEAGAMGAFTRPEVPLSAEEALGALGEHAMRMVVYSDESSTTVSQLRSLWVFVAEYALSITGSPLERVLELNLGKLADRAARGVLRGSGDHR